MMRTRFPTDLLSPRKKDADRPKPLRIFMVLGDFRPI